MGREQARNAARHLSGVDAIAASDLQRARTTAEIIAQHIGVDEIFVEPRLRERDVGPWSGLTNAEIDAGWPGHLERGLRPEGFEGPEATLERARAALVSLSQRFAEQSVLVVSHGGIIRVLEAHCGGTTERLGNLDARRFRVVNARISFIGRESLLANSVAPSAPKPSAR